MTVNPIILSVELTRFLELRQCLFDSEVIEDATFIDALDVKDCLHDAILNEIRSALEDEKAASRLRGELDVMEERLRLIERTAEKKRDFALRAMLAAEFPLLEAPGIRVDTRRAPPVLVISDESLIPDTFRDPQPSRIDYQAIRDALKGGADVPGAALADTEPYLSVRTS